MKMREWTTVDVLRHARHDWLNKVQLIKGYASLNKMEKVKNIVEDIIREAQQESKLSNLHRSEFAELLLTYNWEGHTVQIAYEILDVDRNALPDDGELTGWMKNFFAIVEEAVDPNGDNRLSLSVSTLPSGARFFFEFSGTIKKYGLLAGFLENDCPGMNVIHAYPASAFPVEIIFPKA